MTVAKQPMRLDHYDNSWFTPGRSLLVQMAWYFLGAPVVRSQWMPSSFVRVALLRLFGSQVGEGSVLKPGLRVKFPWRLRVGANTWIGEDVWIDNLTHVEIGNHCCVSQGAYFCTGNHDWSDPAFGLTVRPITLSDGSWAGARSLLCPGVTLGECAIAAAGSVVSKDIPAYEIRGGNPAVFLKKRVVRTSTSEANTASSSALSLAQVEMESPEEAGVAR